MGQLLARSGGSGFFNDFALGLMGRFRGGAAKIAVVASSLFGSISGIAAASALAVGVVTIPLMKKSGIPARLAAAIEACASNGAQLMPPVMGAVAFVMADFLQVPYREVALAALLPSVLYYTALFIQCDLETARYGFGKVARSEIPPMGPVLATGWIFLAPFAAIIGAMFWLNWEPEPSATLASAIIIGLGLFIGYRGARMKLKDIWSAVIETGIGVCEIIVISAIGGYVLGLFQVGGLSFALTAYLVEPRRGEPAAAARDLRAHQHRPRPGAADAGGVRDARHPGRAGADQGRRAGDGRAPLHPLLRHHVAHHAADRHRGVRRRHHRAHRPDGRRLDRDALRLGLLHRAVPLRLLARADHARQRRWRSSAVVVAVGHRHLVRLRRHDRLRVPRHGPAACASASSSPACCC